MPLCDKNPPRGDFVIKTLQSGRILRIAGLTNTPKGYGKVNTRPTELETEPVGVHESLRTGEQSSKLQYPGTKTMPKKQTKSCLKSPKNDIVSDISALTATMVACGVTEIQHVSSQREFDKIRKYHERDSKRELAKARVASLRAKNTTEKRVSGCKKQPENDNKVSKMTSFCPNKSGLICAMLVLAGAGEIVYARESTVPSPTIMGALTSASKAFKGTPMADISESIKTYYVEMASAKYKKLNNTTGTTDGWKTYQPKQGGEREMNTLLPDIDEILTMCGVTRPEGKARIKQLLSEKWGCTSDVPHKNNITRKPEECMSIEF
jgi:hypothetical protein